MIIKKLSNYKSAQCYVIEYDNGDYDFVSCLTPVIKVRFKGGTRFIECTRLKNVIECVHVDWFVDEYLPELHHHEIKEIAGLGMVQI